MKGNHMKTSVLICSVLAFLAGSVSYPASGSMEQSVAILRSNPQYKYLIHVLQLESSGGFLGIGKKTKFLVQIHGVATDPALSPTENSVDETRYLKARPLVGDLNRIVDELHQTVRSTIVEQNWQAMDAAQLGAEMAKIEARLKEQYASDLAAQLAEMAAVLKAKQEASKPVIDRGKK